MKKKIMFACVIALTAIACKKETVPNNQLTQTNTVKYVTPSATDINQTIDEVEATLNQAFGDVSGVRDDFSSTEYVYQLSLNQDGLVDFVSKSLWIEEQAAIIATHKSNMSTNRKIFAIDVVKDAVRLVDEAVAEVKVVIYETAKVFGENRTICQLKDASLFEAADDLTVKYNNCPLRDALYFYEEVETKYIGSHESYYYEENDFLYRRSFSNNESKTELKSVWDYYFGRLEALVEDQRGHFSYDENVVDLQFDLTLCDQCFKNTYNHIATIIYGKGSARLEHFIP
jgi:hypothetical protein